MNASDYLKAAFNGDLDTVKACLDAGCDINATNAKGMSALMLAIWNGGHLDVAQLLVERGIDKDIRQESSNWRGLTFATVNNHAEILQMLLDNGDVFDADTDWKALLYAVQFRSYATAQIVLDQGADVNIRDDKGMTPLMRAARNSDTTALELLLRYNADSNLADNDGMTALMYAATKANVDNIRMLLDAGADPAARNNAGMTALMIAAEKKKAKIEKVLRETGE